MCKGLGKPSRRNDMIIRNQELREVAPFDCSILRLLWGRLPPHNLVLGLLRKDMALRVGAHGLTLLWPSRRKLICCISEV